MKAILTFLIGLFTAMFVAATSSVLLGVSLVITAPVTFGLAIVQSFAMPYLSGGIFAGVLKELWTGELINKFRHEGSWLEKVPSQNQYVDNDVIHLSKIGADPEVLINNTTYPIASVQRTDDDVTLSLDKFDTKNTKITDDELYGLPYDKPGSVVRQHREVLEDSTMEKSLHSLCVAENTASTPVIMTTGVTNGATAPRKRMTAANIIALKKKFDDLKIPKKDRVLVLCNDHVEDLLLSVESFEKNYVNKDITSGKIMNMYGFEIFESAYNPVFSSATSKKVAYGAAANASTDLNASTAFYAGRTVKATGSVKMYHKKAEDNPENRESLIGFRLRHIAFPKTLVGFGAIVSAVHVPEE